MGVRASHGWALALCLTTVACSESHPPGQVTVRGRQQRPFSVSSVLLGSGDQRELRVVAGAEASKTYSDTEVYIRFDALLGPDALGELPFAGDVQLERVSPFAA